MGLMYRRFPKGKGRLLQSTDMEHSKVIGIDWGSGRLLMQGKSWVSEKRE